MLSYRPRHAYLKQQEIEIQHKSATIEAIRAQRDLEVAHLQRHNATLQSALATRTREVDNIDRRVRDLEHALETAKHDAKAEAARLEEDKSDLQEALDAREDELAEGAQRVAKLQTDLDAARDELETVLTQTDVGRLHGEKSVLRSELEEAKKTIAALQADLEAARKDAETLKKELDVEVILLESDKSQLQSALDARSEEVEDAKQKISALETALDNAKKDSETCKADHQNEIDRLESDKSRLQSVLDARSGEVGNTNQRISYLENAMDSVKKEAEALKVGQQNEIDRLESDKSQLQSTLDTRMEEVTEANKSIATLQMSLEAVQDEMEVVKAARNVEGRLREDERSEMQSTLDARTREVAEANQKILDLQAAVDAAQKEAKTVEPERHETGVSRVLEWAPSLRIFRQWTCESAIDADTPISDDDPSNSSGVAYHVFAHNALVHTRHSDWDLACEDAQKSIDARPSAMGYIVKAHAQIRRGRPEEASQALDLAFASCDPYESNLLLVIQNVMLFVAGKRRRDSAISRLQNLIPILRDDETKHCCTQVLAKMYLEQGDSERAAQLLERGQALAAMCTGYHLETITLMFGWEFNKRK